MTAYDTAIKDLNTLASPGSYGWTPQTPNSTIINAYNDFVAQAQLFSAADQATMQGTEEWTTLQIHGPTAAAYDPVATQNASTSLAHLVGTLQTAPTATPPSNSGGFSPGGGQTTTTSPTTSPAAGSAAAAGGATATPPPAGSPQAIVPVTINNPPAAAAAASATPTSTAITRPGVSIPAAVFIGLGALLLGGVLVFMFQPELLGMPKKNPIRRRRKKRKSS